jgi:tetratricopeptide (TPR) repeat protein
MLKKLTIRSVLFGGGIVLFVLLVITIVVVFSFHVLANKFFWMGKEAARKGDYNKAITNYPIGLKFNPWYEPAYNNRGIVYIEHGDYDKGIADFTQVIQLDPQSARTYIRSANIVDQIGN